MREAGLDPNACGSKKGTIIAQINGAHNGTLANGTKDSNLPNPSSLIFEPHPNWFPEIGQKSPNWPEMYQVELGEHETQNHLTECLKGGHRHLFQVGPLPGLHVSVWIVTQLLLEALASRTQRERQDLTWIMADCPSKRVICGKDVHLEEFHFPCSLLALPPLKTMMFFGNHSGWCT